MIVRKLVEGDMYSLDEIFSMEGFDRIALLVFVNAVNVDNPSSEVATELRNKFGFLPRIKSEIDSSKRLGGFNLVHDDASMVDIIFITTRLFDDDLDYERCIETSVIKDALNDGKHDYKHAYVEYVDNFTYDWLEEYVMDGRVNLVF